METSTDFDAAAVAGQRWASVGEPELGLGVLREAADGRITIDFPASGESRTYGLDSAPVRRVRFFPGDRVDFLDEPEARLVPREIVAVRSAGGLLRYETADGEFPEERISAAMSFRSPEERLLAGRFDSLEEAALRIEALEIRERIEGSPVRGLIGARIALVPHQLGIAAEIAARSLPRALLADQVGLGKTIEACLLLHRLVLAGRVSRALILVPEPLIHQWFIELFRRFQMTFAVLDEARCEVWAAENPFAGHQWVLAATDFLASDPARASQAVAAGWDLVILDEAHHLTRKSFAWEVVNDLAATVRGFLMLTATPRFGGLRASFDRLHLLDPDRYPDFEAYAAEAAREPAAADLLARIDAVNDAPPPDLVQDLREHSGSNAGLLKEIASWEHADDADSARRTFANAFLDACGPGRAIFRNTREQLGGFPGRQLHLYPLKPREGESNFPVAIRWLLGWLRGIERSDPAAKVLVIVRTLGRVAEIAEAFEHAGVPLARFDEEMSLMQRDRSAAWFADPEGPAVMACSEIGGEGRNFQFARHLVLLDLPPDVSRLEQRIGRLDRIGQRARIHIHVPFSAGSDQARYIDWLDRGLDALRHFRPAASLVQVEFAENDPEVFPPDRAEMRACDERAEEIILATRERRHELERELSNGHEVLLARTSHQPAAAAGIVAEIHRWDSDRAFERFAYQLFETAGYEIHQLDGRRWLAGNAHLRSDKFPALPEDGLTMTLDRRRALAHEPETFLTADHPLFLSALEAFLASELGTCGFGVQNAPGPKEIFLEGWFVIEPMIQPVLHAARFLPPTPVRTATDHRGDDRRAWKSPAAALLKSGDPSTLFRNPAFRQRILPVMTAALRTQAAELAHARIASAIRTAELHREAEFARLRRLADLGDPTSAARRNALEADHSALIAGLAASRHRLDSLRLVWKEAREN